eukprot:m.96039 g.96039  ORF g.96039 m.96039 type:complete len:424 (-) comp26860_c2_seq1:126-1397(-)
MASAICSSRLRLLFELLVLVMICTSAFVMYASKRHIGGIPTALDVEGVRQQQQPHSDHTHVLPTGEVPALKLDNTNNSMHIQTPNPEDCMHQQTGGDHIKLIPQHRLRKVICKSKNDTDSTHLFSPKIIFIAGLEGCGHHGIVPLLRDLPGIVLIERAEQLLTDFWDPTVSQEQRIKLRGRLLTVMQEKFDGCVTASDTPAKDCSHFVLFGRANFFSYPYDSPRSPLRHPDLLELIDLIEDQSLGARFDLKILVLHRQPFKMIQSNLRRKFVTPEICAKEINRGKRIQYKGECDAMIYLAREAEMQMTFFNSELTALSIEYFRVIDYSKLVQAPSNYSRFISHYVELNFDVQNTLEEHMVKRFRGHITRPRLLQAPRESYLSDLFSSKRKLRWQLIDSGDYDLERVYNLKTLDEATEFGYECF